MAKHAAESKGPLPPLVLSPSRWTAPSRSKRKADPDPVSAESLPVVWPVLAGAVGLAAPVALSLGPSSVLRVVLALALLLWAPGFAVSVWARITDPVLTVVITVGVSLCINVAIGLALLYLHLWGDTQVAWVTGLVTMVLAWIAVESRPL